MCEDTGYMRDGRETPEYGTYNADLNLFFLDIQCVVLDRRCRYLNILPFSLSVAHGYSCIAEVTRGVR